MQLDLITTYHVTMNAAELRVVMRALRGEDPKDQEETDERTRLANLMFEHRASRVSSLAESVNKRKLGQ